MAPLVVTSTPFVLALVLLQLFVLVEFVVHGTEFVFFVVLKKTQPDGGARGCVEELQEFAGVCAIL